MAPLRTGIAELMQLKPISFAWNHAPEDICHGFIAQDVEGVLPETVGEMLHGPGKGTHTTKTLDLMGIVATLTGAMQELVTRITALEGR